MFSDKQEHGLRLGAGLGSGGGGGGEGGADLSPSGSGTAGDVHVRLACQVLSH